MKNENFESLSNLNTEREDLMNRIEIPTMELRELGLSKYIINDIIEDVENTFYDPYYYQKIKKNKKANSV